jgi:hypothetical protein
MHQHKTLAQVILILSIVNFVLAAPVVREIHEARDNVIVRVLAEDMGAVAEKRGNTFGVYTIPREEDWDSGDEGYETAEDEPSGHSSTPTEQPPPPPPAPSQKRPKIFTPAKIKATKTIAGVALFTASILGIVDIMVSFQNSSASRPWRVRFSPYLSCWHLNGSSGRHSDLCFSSVQRLGI